MRQLKRLICVSLILVLAAGIPAMAIDISSIDTSSITFEDDANYMADMMAACADGSEEALLAGAQAEMQRNMKIQAIGSTYTLTEFFARLDSADEIAVALSDYMVESSETAGEDALPVQYKIVASSLNVRQGPGTEYEKVGAFAYGTIVTLLDNQGDWYKVTDDTITGWCKDTYLAPYDGTQETGSETAVSDYTADDLYWLALAIQMEAGSSWLTDEHQLLVGNVVLNRVASDRFPNTIYDVLHQAYQYPWAGRGVSVTPSERAYANAQRLLDGERFCPDNVVFQSTATQGSGVYTSIYDDKLGTTTYFCYL